MPTTRTRLKVLGLVSLLIGGCATEHEWGAVEDKDWAPQVGHVTFTQVTQSLGQPVEKLPLPSGDLKARWFGKPLLLSERHGTMEDQSVEHTENRAYWRDMRFNKEGVLTRAWFSDQRELVNSESP